MLPPLREMREVKRFLVPAGWAAVAAATLSLQLRLRGRPRALSQTLAAVVLVTALAERLQADARKAFLPPPPEPYALLQRSDRTGGSRLLSTSGAGSLRPPHAVAAVARAPHRGGPHRPRPRVVLAGPAGPERVPVAGEPPPAARLGHRQRARRETRRGAVLGPRVSSFAGGRQEAKEHGACSTCCRGTRRTSSVRSLRPVTDAGRSPRQEMIATGLLPSTDPSTPRQRS